MPEKPAKPAKTDPPVDIEEIKKTMTDEEKAEFAPDLLGAQLEYIESL